MTEYSKDEALAFVEAIRLTIQGKIGFQWLSEKLGDLSGYIEAVATENEDLNTFIGQAGLEAEYEAFRAARAGAGDGATDR